jgi:hypothetical protein
LHSRRSGMLFELLIALLIGGAIVAYLAWSDISAWLSTKTNNLSQYGEIIKERLSNGNYKVVAGIFNKRSLRTSSKTWEAKELGQDLQTKFRGTDVIRVDL